MSNVEVEFDSIRELLISILRENPKSRDSDTILYIEACKKLGAKSLEDVEKLNLNIITVHKIRQVIQNKEGLYPPSESVKSNRNRRKVAIRDYMARLK